MEVTIKFRIRSAVEEERLPFRCDWGRPTAWRGFLISSSAHAVAVPLMLALSGFSSGHLIPKSSIAHYDVEPMSVLIPRLFYYPAERGPGNGDSMRRAGHSQGTETGQSNTHGGKVARLHLPAGLTLPEANSRPDIPETILQPQPHTMTAPPGMAAARLVSWPQATAEARKGPVRIPGSSGVRAKMREVDASPRLEAPNPEPTVADVNIGSRLTAMPPALPVQPSSTTPVRVSGAASTTERPGSEAPDTQTGDAVNLIILSATPPRGPQVVTVPPGSNIQSSMAESGGSAIFEFGPNPEIADLAGNRLGEAAHDTGRSGTMVPGGGGAAASSKRSVGERDWEKRRSTGDAAAPSAPSPRSLAEGAPPHSAKTAQLPKPAKESPHPIHRAHDVVIIQPAGGGSYSEDWGTLTGKPIYTVYLDVGTVKAWALHYCLPKLPQKQGAQQTVVYLDQLETVEAPYPLTTEMPLEKTERRSGYTLIQGVLTASGKFRDLRVLNPDGRPEAILDLLARWVFRPALKGSTPVDVEALLAIPPSL